MRAEGFQTWSVSLPLLCRLFSLVLIMPVLAHLFVWHSVQFLPQGVSLLSVNDCHIIPVGGSANQSSSSSKLCIIISSSNSSCPPAPKLGILLLITFLFAPRNVQTIRDTLCSFLMWPSDLQLPAVCSSGFLNQRPSIPSQTKQLSARILSHKPL